MIQSTQVPFKAPLGVFFCPLLKAIALTFLFISPSQAGEVQPLADSPAIIESISEGRSFTRSSRRIFPGERVIIPERSRIEFNGILTLMIKKQSEVVYLSKYDNLERGRYELRLSVERGAVRGIIHNDKADITIETPQGTIRSMTSEESGNH